jgi:predicted DNA-binding transcriptional regulator YafY
MKMMTSGNRYTVEELAERLDTSYRSIYRYIDTFKEVGFVVHKEEGAVYRLGKESPYFKDISQLIHFTDEEAHIVNQLIGALDDTNTLKQNLRRKLSSVYNCTSLANSIVKGKNAENVNHIIEAIEEHKQVILHDYSSSHTGSKRNREVEPIAFTTNYVQIWCYDLSDGKTKIFNTARIGSVEILDTEWQHEAEHRCGQIDIFRNTGFEQMRVRLRLGVMSHNLLIEEYPLSERDLTQVDDTHWLLDTEVCNYAGIGRFVMGLIEDIEVVDSPDFVEYLRNKSNYLSQRL